MSDADRARLTRLADVLAAAGRPDAAAGICRAAAEALPVSGASLMVIVDGLASPLGSSDARARRLADLQNTLGEGPALDAHAAGRPVPEPDLANPLQPRWVAFGAEALRAGAGAIFAYPLRLGAVRLGALTLHNERAGALSTDQHGDARTVADVAMRVILADQADAPLGALSADMERRAGNDAVVHQASGMVSAQLGVGVGEALARLRGHAYRSDRTMAEVARDVVARRLTIGD